MRILDRERYWAYLKAYVICFTALVGLYIVIDAFSNFDEFTQRGSGAVEIFQIMGRYYLVHMSQFYDRLCGVIGMMAAIFTVTWMQRNNELLAMLAAGVSTQRVIRPVIVSAVIVSGLSIVNQEFIMPVLGEEIMKSHADDGSKKVRPTGRVDPRGVYIHGSEADRKSQTVISFNATLSKELFGKIYEINAAQARYIPEGAMRMPMRGGWLLRGAKINLPIDDLKDQDVLTKLKDADGFPPPLADVPYQGDVYFLRSSLTFMAVTRKRDWYKYATTVDLIRGQSDPANDSEKVSIAVFLHSRLMRPCLAVTLLLMSLPQVLGGFGRNMFINLGLSLGTAAVFYAVMYVFDSLGTNEMISPEMSAWAPMIGFGTFAMFRWDAIRT